MSPRRRLIIIPRSLAILGIVGLGSLVAVGLGAGAGLAGLVVLGLISLVIVGFVTLVTVGLNSPVSLVVGGLICVGLLGLISGLALLGLSGLVAGLVAGLALLTLLILLLAFATGLVVVRIVSNTHNVNGDEWQSSSVMPQMRSLAWARGLLPPDEGAAWWAEVISTLAETPDLAQRRAYVRGYRRGLPLLWWRSWVLHLSSARRREVS